MLRPRVPRKVFGGRSAARKARDELWAAVLPPVLYVVFGKVSIMVLESHRRDMTNKQINDDVIDRSLRDRPGELTGKRTFRKVRINSLESPLFVSFTGHLANV